MTAAQDTEFFTRAVEIEGGTYVVQRRAEITPANATANEYLVTEPDGARYTTSVPHEVEQAIRDWESGTHAVFGCPSAPGLLEAARAYRDALAAVWRAPSTTPIAEQDDLLLHVREAEVQLQEAARTFEADQG